MFKTTLIATFAMVLISVWTPSSGRRPDVHVDCLHHDQPQLCTRVVDELLVDLGHFNDAFSPPNLDRLATFYHQDAIVFSRGRFFVGREEIKTELLTPLVAGITAATVDISAFRFQVINPDLVIAYGSPRTVITLPGGGTVTLPPLTQSHTWIRTSENGERHFVLLTDHNGGSERATVQTNAANINPDCVNHQTPRLCNRVVQELTSELDRLNDAFGSGNADELAAFYHQSAILFVDSTGRFFRGRDEIRNDFFAPLISGILDAKVDISAFHFRVIGPNLVVLFGSPATVVTFKDGSTVTLPPLPQTLTWVRQGDRTRPFAIITDHE